MQRHNEENQGNEHDQVELSRRSFFGRLAVGAVLSIAMPGIAHAAKSTAVKADKNHRLAQSTRSAVRLPKHGADQKTKAVRQIAKVGKTAGGNNYKVATAEHGRLQAAHADYHTQHSRVRDVYTGKKQSIHTASHHVGQHHHGGRVQSIMQPAPREPIFDTLQEPLFLADRGRFATHRALAFQNPHTGDKLNLTYFERGRYLSDALDEISFLLRDHRTDDVHPIDPELLDQLHDLKQMLGLHQPFDVICGYRSPLTNAKLHAEHTGVANNSFHMHGRAVDIRIERFDLRRIHNAALAMHRGGVGYYPSSNFIHLDTGTFRTWSL
ncbi:YcbK family protein [Methylomonas sp. 2BW1-5-20]|uniref:YcbK family protein n=1 Tax=Methylomonas sp. 2BW1-5-20 TaxID=3376686 RepID=UPI00404FBE05